jgi:hypothetical protein
MLRKDDMVEVFARLGPGRVAVRAMRVCRLWEQILLLPSTYNRMVACGNKPVNGYIFGANSGNDPNNPSGYQGKLADWDGDPGPYLQLRARLKECTTSRELSKALSSAPSRMERDIALNLYKRFIHAPLWTICGNSTLDEAEQAEMVRLLLVCGAEVDLTGGSGVRTTPLQEAARINRPRVVQLLLLGGAVVDKYGGSFQQTPLALVCGLANSVDLVHRFVAAGANIAAVDEDGLLPVHRAMLAHSLPVLNYFARLFRWKSDEETQMDRPTLLHFSDRSFHLVPTVESAFDLCVTLDWLEGVEFLAPHLPKGDALERARKQLSADVISVNVEGWMSRNGGGVTLSSLQCWCVDHRIKGSFASNPRLLRELDKVEVLEVLLRFRAWPLLREYMQHYKDEAPFEWYVEHLASRWPMVCGERMPARAVESIASPQQWRSNCTLGNFDRARVLELALEGSYEGVRLTALLKVLIETSDVATAVAIRLATDGKHRFSDGILVHHLRELGANLERCTPNGDSIVHVMMRAGHCTARELSTALVVAAGPAQDVRDAMRPPKEFINDDGQNPRDVAASEADAEEYDAAIEMYQGTFEGVSRALRYVEFENLDGKIEGELEHWISAFRERRPHRIEFIGAVRGLAKVAPRAPIVNVNAAPLDNSSSSSSANTSDLEGSAD